MLCQKKSKGRCNMKGRGWQTDWGRNDRSREQESGKERDSGVSVGSKDRSLCVGGKQERDVGPSNGGRCEELSLLLYCKSCFLWFVEETVEHHLFLKIGKRERHLWQVDTELMTRSPIDQMTSKLRSPAVSSTPTEPVIWWLRERGCGKEANKVSWREFLTNKHKFDRPEVCEIPSAPISNWLCASYHHNDLFEVFCHFGLVLKWGCIGGKAFASDSEQNRKVLMARKALTKSLRLIDQSPDLGRGQQSTLKHLH